MELKSRRRIPYRCSKKLQPTRTIALGFYATIHGVFSTLGGVTCKMIVETIQMKIRVINLHVMSWINSDVQVVCAFLKIGSVTGSRIVHMVMMRITVE